MTEKTKVVITEEQKSVKVPKGLRMLIRRCCLAALQLTGYQGAAIVNVILTDNNTVSKHLGTTDTVEAISVASNTPGVLGDVFISLEQAQAVAAATESTFQKEVCLLTVREMLHLTGCEGDGELREYLDMIMYQLGFPLTTAREYIRSYHFFHTSLKQKEADSHAAGFFCAEIIDEHFRKISIESLNPSPLN